MTTPQTSLEKSTFYDLWAALTDNQRAYVLAALRLPTKKEAAAAVGLKPNTVYGWGKTVDIAIEALRFDMTTAAADILAAALAESALVLVNSLQDPDPGIRIRAAEFIQNIAQPRPASPSDDHAPALTVTALHRYNGPLKAAEGGIDTP